jgi:hypothetical protein
MREKGTGFMYPAPFCDNQATHEKASHHSRSVDTRHRTGDHGFFLMAAPVCSAIS